MRYVKKPDSVQVIFARESGTLDTREGQVSFAPGDALLTGVEGERWPIKAADFQSTYEPVPPARAGQDGLYRKRAVHVDARQAARALSIPTHSASGSLQARAGDWIVTDDQGQSWVVADSIFRATYAPSTKEDP